MNKFDFSKEFGNIDSKYIHEAEEKWVVRKKSKTSYYCRAAAACAALVLVSVLFFNPTVQAKMKALALSIGESFGFSSGVDSYSEILNSSRTDNGITVTLKEVVLDDGVLLAAIHEKISSTEDLYFEIDTAETTINGENMDSYGSGTYLPYTIRDLQNSCIEEEADEILENRFRTPSELGENPSVHLVIQACRTDELDKEAVGRFSFDFTVSRAEMKKQTLHKTLADTSIITEAGTVIFKEFSLNPLQSAITAELPERLLGGYELQLRGNDSKGNKVWYRLSDAVSEDFLTWNFRTDLWGAYEDGEIIDENAKRLAIPDMDSEYLELQLYVRPIMDKKFLNASGDSSEELQDAAETEEYAEEYGTEYISGSEEEWEAVGEKIRIEMR